MVDVKLKIIPYLYPPNINELLIVYQLSHQFLYGHKNYKNYKFPGSNFIMTGFIDGKVKLEVHIRERERKEF